MLLRNFYSPAMMMVLSIMTNRFIICCKKKTPSHSQDAYSLYGKELPFYIRCLLRASAHRSLRLDLLVLEILEISITLY